MGFLLCVGSRVYAQAVELRLRDDAARVPVTGAIVRLLDQSGAVGQGLTNELGRLILRAPRAGTYRLKIDRIGFTGLLTEPFELADGQTLPREIGVASHPQLLPTIEVREKNRCGARGEAGTLAGALWEEIQKALTASIITDRQGAVPLHLREFLRDVGINRRIEREWVTSSSVVHGQSYRSLPPADLARKGFVQLGSDSSDFAAPDAVLLLSQEFVDTHCFRAATGSGSLAGLAFEPVRGRLVPDVQGVLWVDRFSSELRFLEYRYTGLSGLERADLGGRVEFIRLATGAWIVSYWHIRMPRLAPAAAWPLIPRLTGYLDRGGRAEVALNAAGAEDRAMVKGRVTDSTTGGGLADAVVRVRGFPDSVLTDGAGRFHLAVAASGDQVVTARHPKLGLLRDSASREVLLSVGDSTVADFAVPPPAAFVRSLCGGAHSRSGLVGLAWGADGMPADNLEIQVTRPALSRNHSRRARSGPRGLYALCDLPPGLRLTVALLDGVLVLAEQRVQLARGEYRWVELRAATQATMPPADISTTGRNP